MDVDRIKQMVVDRIKQMDVDRIKRMQKESNRWTGFGEMVSNDNLPQKRNKNMTTYSYALELFEESMQIFTLTEPLKVKIG